MGGIIENQKVPFSSEFIAKYGLLFPVFSSSGAHGSRNYVKTRLKYKYNIILERS